MIIFFNKYVKMKKNKFYQLFDILRILTPSYAPLSFK